MKKEREPKNKYARIRHSSFSSFFLSGGWEWKYIVIYLAMSLQMWSLHLHFLLRVSVDTLGEFLGLASVCASVSSMQSTCDTSIYLIGL